MGCGWRIGLFNGLHDTANTPRDANIQDLKQMWQEKADALQKQNQPLSDGLSAFKWMIEELRVSLFAQELKTPYPVLMQRLVKNGICWVNKELCCLKRFQAAESILFYNSCLSRKRYVNH